MTEKTVRSTYKNVLWTGKPRNFLGFTLNFTRYIITESKLITLTGLLNLKEDEVELYRITDKKIELPLGQRIFGCGTLILHAKDADTPTKTLKSIKHTRKVGDMLGEKLEKLRDKYKMQQREMFGALGNVDNGHTDSECTFDESEDLSEE